ncbi:hypothetical protein BC629DRAFT_1539966, partial [Irpex lacteus]
WVRVVVLHLTSGWGGAVEEEEKGVILISSTFGVLAKAGGGDVGDFDDEIEEDRTSEYPVLERWDVIGIGEPCWRRSAKEVRGKMNRRNRTGRVHVFSFQKQK